MAKRKYFDLKSAYGQLLILVFLPICVLTGAGSFLVLQETTKAALSKQKALAVAALMRYEPVFKEMLPQLIEQSTDSSQSLNAIDNPNNSQNHSAYQHNLKNGSHVSNQLKLTHEQMNRILSLMKTDQHVQRVAIIDESGKVIASEGFASNKPWGDRLPLNNLPSDNMPSNWGISHIDTPVGSAYGHYIGSQAGTKYWLFVDMDNEPLHISGLKVLLAIVMIGLTATLLLLLTINIYAKRWVIPIYNMRLHLQQTTPDNLYLPINTNSGGELNLLQQDLIKTLRRLYREFQELKQYAEQTENDLRVGLDEMEIRNISNRRARDAAVSTSQAKSAFLANISHELRTPLNSIDGFINLLSRNGMLTLEQDLYVQTIRKSSAHLLALVNDVLDFSKIEAGKLVLDHHEFDFYAAIYDVMDMLSPLASEKGLDMTVLYYNDVPAKIMGDALRVKQVLTNLVSNAIKFTDAGEIIVRVSLDESPVKAQTTHESWSNDTVCHAPSQPNPESITEQASGKHSQEVSVVDNVVNSNVVNSIESRNKAHEVNTGIVSKHPMSADRALTNLSTANILISVQDSGRGIPKSEQGKLFQSFSQGDPSITRQFGGTGLGLVISKQLTRLMGGKIGYYDNATKIETQGDSPSDSLSAPSSSKGSTFWFLIPAHVDVIEALEQQDVDAMLPVLTPFAQSQSSSEPLQLLAWFTHSINLQVLSSSLRSLNIEITQAKSLAGALDWLKEKGSFWDWVIIDGGGEEAQNDMAALLKQIRLHYQGKLAIFGYQVALDASMLERYKAYSLYQPLDKRQLFNILDTQQTIKKSFLSTLRWKGVTVLAVDDHPPNLLVLEALLDELSIDVITASSGFDAIEIINKQLINSIDSNDPKRSKKIDLIFMDIQMPRMSGHEAAKQIRHIESSLNKKNMAAIPIIALTAHGLSDERDKLIESGINDYVSKPISQPQLLQILQRWLDGRNSAQLQPVQRYHSLEDAPKPSVSKNNTSSQPKTHTQHTRIDTDDGDINTKLQNQPVIDWQDALIRSANKPDLAAQLFKLLLDTIAGEITGLYEAWQLRDRAQLAQIAHRILGASRYTGVPQLRHASQDFEDKCQLNIQHTSPVQFDILQPYYDGLLMALHNLENIDLTDYPIVEQAMSDYAMNENDMTWKMI